MHDRLMDLIAQIDSKAEEGLGRRSPSVTREALVCIRALVAEIAAQATLPSAATPSPVQATYVAVPAGYALVPKKATSEMFDHVATFKIAARADVDIIYRALLASAPALHRNALGEGLLLAVAVRPFALPDKWLSEVVGGPADELSYGQGYRRGFNDCREKLDVLNSDVTITGSKVLASSLPAPVPAHVPMLSVDTEETRILLRAYENTPFQSGPALIAHLAQLVELQRDVAYQAGLASPPAGGLRTVI